MTVRLFTGLFLLAASSSAVAVNRSDIGSVNFNIEKCYQQTQLEQGGRKRYCNQVIRSDIVNRDKKAVALHNRGVINLNNGDYLAALKDFESASKVSHNMKKSLLAANNLRKVLHASTRKD